MRDSFEMQGLPVRLIMEVPGLSAHNARILAIQATDMAKRMAPKLSGAGAASLMPFWRPSEFGVMWPPESAYLWLQEEGVGPFTMRALAGKVIPMWIDDPTGKERQDNPKARVRTTASGRTQVLIFRRAAKIGQTRRKSYTTPSGGRYSRRVPASYPGAPGRIASRHVSQARGGYGNAGRIATHPNRPHIGVRWRFPGLHGRQFLHHAILDAARAHGISGTITTGKEAG